jgi:hypothetical protein
MARSSTLLAALIVAGGLCTHALAETPGADWLTQEQVTQKLSTAGYTHITKLEADDGYWEGKGIKNGKLMEFKADPRSGAILHEELED